MTAHHSKQQLSKCILSAAISIALFVLTVTIVDSSPSPGENVWQKYRDQVASPPAPPPVSIQWYGKMGNEVMTGTAGGTWVIKGSSEDLELIQEYHTASFDQSIVDRTEESVTVTIRGDAFIETDVGYPLDTDTLPSDVKPCLEPEQDKQSDAPEIVQQAKQLVEGAEMEAQAVVAILDWVRGNITYDFTPGDALSVYQNRSGTCHGFANLSIALLRAAGIPARYQVGCALWSLPSGGGHAWIEVYYPDLGWVPSDPQCNENYVGEHLVVTEWWELCGKSSTNITYTERTKAPVIHYTKTLYDDDIWPIIYSAGISSWDRNPARSSVSRISSMISLSDTQSTHHMEVNSTHWYLTIWEIESSDPWLSVSPMEGDGPTAVTVSVDASTLPLGLHSGGITLSTPYQGAATGSSRDIPVSVRVVEELYETFLPLVTRDAVSD